MARYQKPYLGPAQQLDLLQHRGLIVTDRDRATACLERIGYYRLSAYWYPLRIFDLVPSRMGEAVNRFRDNATFAQAVDLYLFDKRFRHLMLDALERIEVALRVAIALELGKRSPWAHRDPLHLRKSFTTAKIGSGYIPHRAWLEKQDRLVVASREEFIQHFRAKYGQTEPPIWIAIELWDFGLTSHLLAGMLPEDQAAVATRFGLPHQDLLISWIRALNHVRNVCAHHARFWNRVFVDTPKPPRPGQIPLLAHLDGNQACWTRAYGAVSITQFLLRHIHPESSWSTRLSTLIGSLPEAPGVLPSNAGFPANWREYDLWRAAKP